MDSGEHMRNIEIMLSLIANDVALTGDDTGMVGFIPIVCSLFVY